MKTLNEEFEIIKISEHRYNPRFKYIKWHLNPHNTSKSGKGVSVFWDARINNFRFSENREEQLVEIQPKLDKFFRKLKTKKAIINKLESVGIEIDCYIKQKKKDEMICQIKTHLRAVFKYQCFEKDFTRKPIETFLYSL